MFTVRENHMFWDITLELSLCVCVCMLHPFFSSGTVLDKPISSPNHKSNITFLGKGLVVPAGQRVGVQELTARSVREHSVRRGGGAEIRIAPEFCSCKHFQNPVLG